MHLRASIVLFSFIAPVGHASMHFLHSLQYSPVTGSHNQGRCSGSGTYKKKIRFLCLSRQSDGPANPARPPLPMPSREAALNLQLVFLQLQA
jgi:hypothetical protein